VKINYKTAAQWHRRAPEQGYPGAQLSLGNMFYNGQGVAQSRDEAVKWFLLAAAQGWACVLYNLGLCYVKGHGVPKEDSKALRSSSAPRPRGTPRRRRRSAKLRRGSRVTPAGAPPSRVAPCRRGHRPSNGLPDEHRDTDARRALVNQPASHAATKAFPL